MNTEKAKILIIDDEEDARVYLKRILERKGYTVFAASDGEEGLEKIKELRIEIVFSDIMMPRLSGIDFLKEVHHYSLSTQVIMITGQSDLNLCIEAVEYGACGYLTKPVEIQELLKMILVAERNIFEKKEMVKKAIDRLEENKADDILRRVLKTGKDVDAKKEVIKKIIDKDKETTA